MPLAATIQNKRNATAPRWRQGFALAPKQRSKNVSTFFSACGKLEYAVWDMGSVAHSKQPIQHCDHAAWAFRALARAARECRSSRRKNQAVATNPNAPPANSNSSDAFRRYVPEAGS